MGNINVEKINNYYEQQNGKITIGYDGFVDEVWNITNPSARSGESKFFEKLSDFANAMLERGSGGMSFGSVQKRRSHGGFAANTGKAAGRLLGTHGELTLLGAFGLGEMDPVFEEMKEFNTLSLGEPVYNTIYEFHDSKVFMGSHRFDKKPSAERTWQFLVDTLGMDGLRKAFSEADVVGFGYLGNVRVFEDIITNLIDNFLASGKCHRLFFDFANIVGRPKDEILGIIKALSVLNKKVPMTLSMNEHEGKILLGFMGRDFRWDEPAPGVEDDMAYTREQLGLDELLIHTPFFAVGASESEGAAVVRQRNATETVITTGAGDNFNGGYISTHVQKGVLTLPERLFVANAVTGSYVRVGNSPKKDALKIEMDELIKVV